MLQQRLKEKLTIHETTKTKSIDSFKRKKIPQKHPKQEQERMNTIDKAKARDRERKQV